MIGKSISHYKIVERLGAGGMGEVYLASDTRMDRKVALKLLPPNFTRNPERVRRFQQEARAALILNHPNIVTIYEIGEADGQHFIATEFIQGETLRTRMVRNSLTRGEALEIASQVASALTAAHEARIVHRDIKPENIMLRRDGFAKVLDFGLAKLTEGPGATTDAEAPTRVNVKTDPGIVMGTANYMSPEQARGTKVDGRTDIWSLGVVLYEMVAGRMPFEGETPSDIISFILHKEAPPLMRYAPEAPPELQRIVDKSLTKNREERYQTVKDLLIDLRRLSKRLDFENELQRSTSAEVIEGAASRIYTTSNAEYIVGAIKHHKRGAWLVLAALLAASVVLAYFAYSRYFAGRSEASIRSIAVLPFTNTSNNPDAEYLSDGISESLINSLSQLPGVKVIAKSSSFRYKGKEVDAQEVARALGVEAVLTGRVVQRGDALAISIELVDARDNTHLWGEQYNRKLSDLLFVQQEISREVAEKLRLRLTGEEQQRVTRRYTENTEAYELYLKGRYFASKPTEADFKKSIEYFQQAVEKDPNYALAYVGLGRSYLSLGGVLGFVSPSAVAQQGKAAVMKALGIDETLDDAHATFANFKLYYDWDWNGAETEFKRTIELNPNNAAAHSGYGTYLEALGRFDEAVAERERSRQLDPVSAIATADVGYPLYYARRYDQALSHYRKGLELDPNLSWGHLWIGQTLVQQGRYTEAIAEINKAIALSGGNVRDIATLGHAYAVSGRKSEALKVLDELQGRAKQKYVSPYFIALIYTGLGEKDQAFGWLQKAYEERHPYLILINVEPVFDSLRSDPRFSDLVRSIGLKP
ncbi:MAG: protein kinase [Pyrinomonadaceae bacterium]